MNRLTSAITAALLILIPFTQVIANEVTLPKARPPY